MISTEYDGVADGGVSHEPVQQPARASDANPCRGLERAQDDEDDLQGRFEEMAALVMSALLDKICAASSTRHGLGVNWKSLQGECTHT